MADRMYSPILRPFVGLRNTLNRLGMYSPPAEAIADRGHTHDRQGEHEAREQGNPRRGIEICPASFLQHTTPRRIRWG